MTDELKTIKFQLMLSPSEAEAIDDWGFKNRIRTRAEAIRRLCQIALIFDEQRKTIVDDYKTVIDSAVQLTSLAKKLPRDREPSRLEVEYSMAAAVTFREIAEAWPAIRIATGMAYNLKQEGDVDEIIANTNEMVAGWRDHFGDSWKTLRGKPIPEKGKE